MLVFFVLFVFLAEGFCEDAVIETAPPLICCENEEASTCKQTCPPQDCSWDPTRYACKPGPCQPGCNCKKDHLRDASGKCIPQELCPPTPKKCTGKNEEINPCPSACFGDQCGELDEDTAACNTLVPHVCKPRCMCRNGYQRDSNGHCIPKEECPAIS